MILENDLMDDLILALKELDENEFVELANDWLGTEYTVDDVCWS